MYKGPCCICDCDSKGIMAHKGFWHRVGILKIEFCGPKVGDSECPILFYSKFKFLVDVV